MLSTHSDITQSFFSFFLCKSFFMDAEIDIQTGDYTTRRINGLANAVYIRLMTPRGSWWQDTSLGSRLHELEREKDIEHVYILMEHYAKEALEPLLQDGRAKNIVVTVQKLKEGQCLLLVEVEDATGQPYTFNYIMRVS